MIVINHLTFSLQMQMQKQNKMMMHFDTCTKLHCAVLQGLQGFPIIQRTLALITKVNLELYQS